MFKDIIYGKRESLSTERCPKAENSLKSKQIVSILPHHSCRSLPQTLASAATELSNPALGTVTQERVGGCERDIETKVGGGGGL